MKNVKKHTKYDLYVIKVSRTGVNIGMSKLCEKCVIAVNTIPQKMGYNINNIIYSNRNGEFITTTPKKLLESNDHHISKYYINNNYKSLFSCDCGCECDDEEEDDEA